MSARDDGTPRRVLAMVEIRTRGKLCDARRPDACPKLGIYSAVCSLFDKKLDVTETGEPLRCPGCLALDGPERTPEEAYPYGMGAQDG